MKLFKFLTFFIMTVLAQMIRIKLRADINPDDDFVNPNEGVRLNNIEY
jgi:hypothetical protein